MNKIKYTPEFNDLWDLKPKRGGGNPKIKAFKAYTTRIKQGYEHAEIKAGLIRYATFCDKTAKIGSEFVMQMATFFGLNECWLEDWDVPIEIKKETPEQKGRRLNMPAKVGESMAEWESRIMRHRE